jgi:poly(A) polymerase
VIKQFISQLLGTDKKNKFGKRVEVQAAEHGIDPKLVDHRAFEVVQTLQQAGFAAYIVGGAVRDLLVGLRPKDFDVATDATPEQVKGLFRRAFIIGRRFRIVHVVFGRGRQDRGLSEVIEVSTFRAYLESADAEQVSGNEKTSRNALAGMTHAVDASGRVLRDNVWGPQDEDAARRDFTINAMYYDPISQVVVDYHKGLADSKKLSLKLIGDPATRYREDPVRIIRAVRFSAKLAKLGFKLDSKTSKPMVTCAPLLADVPQSRLFDEMLKLLQTGHAIASVAQLRLLGLERGIYPLLDVVVERADQPFIAAALADTDRRVGEGKPVAPSFLLACVLWADVKTGWDALLARGGHPFPALMDAIDEVFNTRIGDISGRGKLAADMREIWTMQPRFDKRAGSTPFSLVEHERFRAGFDFLRLRADIGEVDQLLADWWQEFSMADDATREDLVFQIKEQQRQQQRQAPKEGAPRRAPREAQSGQTDTARQDPNVAALDAGAGLRNSGGNGGGNGGGYQGNDQLSQQGNQGDYANDAPKRRRRRSRNGRGGAGNGDGGQ